MRTGTIHVNTENIFPIIKKFLYTDQEIFLRELVSNAVDATQKLRMLARRGETDIDVSDLRIEVAVDTEAGTITISDQGIGMTAEEVEKYITQIAFSSAEEFVEKIQGQDDAATIIGHFGLGFYSSFMVADTVEIISKSYRDEPAVRWTNDGSPEYTLEDTERDGQGTDVILHISEEGSDFLDESAIGGLLDKYCKFLPVPIVFGTTERTEGEGDDATTVTEPRIVNNTQPAWTRPPSDLTDEDYLAFYRELYPMAEDPLFWIHLNVDFPFELTGILYFPRLRNQVEAQRNKIGLYSNQVFVTDNVESIVPEFLTLLHGVIDSPDIPLNVSRSSLQSDRNVKKITGHISKKVSDKLVELFNNDRSAYEDKWESIGVFVKYGMLSDEKFHERTLDACLFEDTEGAFTTLSELKEAVAPLQTDKNDRIILLYSNDVETHDSYIRAARNRGYTVLKMDVLIDNHFMQHLEVKDGDVQFKRVDADSLDKLIETDDERTSVLSEKEEERLKTAFEETIDASDVTIELKPLSPDDLPVMITQSEWMRRMREMQAMGGGGMSVMGDLPKQINLVVNTNHPLAQKVLNAKSRRPQLVRQLYDLALLSQGMLRGGDLTDFIGRSVEVMQG